MMIISYFVIAFPFIFVEQKVLSLISKKLYESVIQTGDDLLGPFPNNQSLFHEVENLKTFDEKRNKLSFLTKIISIIEFIIFTILIIVLIYHFNNNYYEIFLNFSKFLGAWLVIKTLGSYGQWAAAVFGRATFYIFMICTFVNIFFAVMLGLAWFVLQLC